MQFLLASIPTLSNWELLGRLATATALGAALGIERELRDHEAGFRTHLLVCLGSAIFTVVSAYGFTEFLVGGVPCLDLDYVEDSAAQVDMNVVMTGGGRLVEVQATAERDPFARETLDELLELAAGGITEIGALQAEAVARELP